MRSSLLAILFTLVTAANAQRAPTTAVIFGIGAPSGNDSPAKLGPVAIDRSGRIFHLDVAEASIVAYSGAGKRLFAIGRRGDGPGEFRKPVAMVIDSANHLLVMDEAQRAVHRFDLSRSGPPRLLDRIPVPLTGHSICILGSQLVVLKSSSASAPVIHLLALQDGGATIVRSFAPANIVDKRASSIVIRMMLLDEGRLACNSAQQLVALAAEGSGTFHVYDKRGSEVARGAVPGFAEIPVMQDGPERFIVRAGPGGVMSISAMEVAADGSVALQASTQPRDYSSAQGPSQQFWFDPAGRLTRKAAPTRMWRVAARDGILLCGLAEPEPTLVVTTAGSCP
ncbi:MAG: 6-bladed beta-propeller [Gemmatimonadota bacterium]